MSNQLLFLLDLIGAMDAPDPQTAIAAALGRIQRLDAWRESRGDVLQSWAFVAELARAWGVVFEVARDGRRVGVLEPIGGQGTNSLQGICPGNYTIKLSTGLLVWEGRITREDALWVYARRGQEVGMAAGTKEGVFRKPSRSDDLLGGGATLEVLPGAKTGTMRIVFNG